jgi:hypothetical protein
MQFTHASRPQVLRAIRSGGPGTVDAEGERHTGDVDDAALDFGIADLAISRYALLTAPIVDGGGRVRLSRWRCGCHLKVTNISPAIPVETDPSPHTYAGMSLVDVYRDRAEDCAFLSRRSKDEETRLAYLRMEAAWRALASEQERLDRMGSKHQLSR